MFKFYNIVWHAVSRKLRDSQIPVGLACTRYHRWFELLWPRMHVEKIIDHIHWQSYDDQFLLTCHFCFLGNSENKQQRLEAFFIMHKYAKYTEYAKYAQYAQHICKYAINMQRSMQQNMLKNMQIICQICKYILKYAEYVN